MLDGDKERHARNQHRRSADDEIEQAVTGTMMMVSMGFDAVQYISPHDVVDSAAAARRG